MWSSWQNACLACKRSWVLSPPKPGVMPAHCPPPPHKGQRQADTWCLLLTVSFKGTLEPGEGGERMTHSLTLERSSLSRVYVGSQFLWIQPPVSWPCAFSLNKSCSSCAEYNLPVPGRSRPSQTEWKTMESCVN